jgi:hypothetical protein
MRIEQPRHALSLKPRSVFWVTVARVIWPSGQVIVIWYIEKSSLLIRFGERPAFGGRSPSRHQAARMFAVITEIAERASALTLGDFAAAMI